MICTSGSSERLYLSKGDPNIYIDNCKILQCHIDSIRFLYQQYIKKKPGVIINYGPGYSRNLPIVLFLKAVHCLLNKPVLVLCKEGSEHNWIELFQTWTDLSDNVLLENQEPGIKKLIFINTMSNIPAITRRREWSMVVVEDGDEFVHEIVKQPFKADFKIYTTLVDIKENLHLFSQIYKWLYPEQAKDKTSKWKFDPKHFTPDWYDPCDVVDKAVLLDAFMADIVARHEEPENQVATDRSSAIAVSRKNKDATGTKIKRSKRIYEDDENMPLVISKKGVESIPLESSATTSNDSTQFVSHQNLITEDFSIENLRNKRNKETGEDFVIKRDSQKIDINMDPTDSQSQINLYYEPDSVTDFSSDRFYEMDTLGFDNDMNEDHVSIAVEPAEVINNDLNKGDETQDASLVPGDKVASEPNTATESKSKENNVQNEISDSSVDTDLNNSPKIRNRIFQVNEQVNLKESPVLCDEIKVNYNEVKVTKDLHPIDGIKSDIADVKLNNNNFKSNLVFQDTSLNCDDISTEDNDIEMNREFPSEVEVVNADNKLYNGGTIDFISNNIKIDSSLNEITKLNEHKFTEDRIVVTNTTVTPEANILKRVSIEDQIKDMEEKALKKFKGSLLDNLF